MVEDANLTVHISTLRRVLYLDAWEAGGSKRFLAAAIALSEG